MGHGGPDVAGGNRTATLNVDAFQGLFGHQQEHFAVSLQCPGKLAADGGGDDERVIRDSEAW